MSARHKRAHARIVVLENHLRKAAAYIESAADVITNELDPDDIDGENADAREYAATCRRIADGALE